MYDFFVLTGFFLVMSSVGIISCINAVLKVNKYKKWRWVQANIIEAGLQQWEVKGLKVFNVKARYAYEYDCKLYTAQQLGIGYEASKDLKYHKDILDKLQSGLSVIAYIDPKKPSQSYIMNPKGSIWDHGFLAPLLWIALMACFTSIFPLLGSEDFEQLLDQITIIK